MKWKFHALRGTGIGRLVKAAVVCLIFLSFSLGAAAQSEKKVTLNLNNVSLEKVVDEIKRQTGLNFLYNSSLFSGVTEVSVIAQNEPWDTVLDRALKMRNFTYEITNDIIVIKRLPAVMDTITEPRVSIAGKVADANGMPLPGVSVFSHDTGRGTTTNKDGEFLIFLSKDTKNLQVSFIGMKTVQLRLESGRSHYDIVMEEEIGQIGEVVVTGYQTINRADMVGSYNVVKASEIYNPAYSTIDQMLQGQVAGMTVLRSSSRVGTSPEIEIRGTSTFLGNKSPLWVVDGIIQPDPLRLEGNSSLMGELRTIIGNQVSWLNPADIEDITVLKDASATAIYGSKASNGVIVITTKKITTDRTLINYNGNVSVTSRPNYGRFNMMNSQERIMVSEEAMAWGTAYANLPLTQPNTYEGAYRMYMNGDYTLNEFLDRRSYLESVNTDWLKLLTRSAVQQNHNLSISGGNSNTNYRFSGGYTNQQGQEIGNDSERYSAMLVVNTKLRKNINLRVDMSASLAETTGFASSLISPLNYAVNASRAIPAYDEYGDPLFYNIRGRYDLNDTREGFQYNFTNERDNSGTKSDRTDLAFSLHLDWKITPWLTYQAWGGLSRASLDGRSHYTERTYYIAQNFRGYDFNEFTVGTPEYQASMLPIGGQLYTNNTSQRTYNVTNQLLFQQTFNEDHRINAIVGAEIRSTTDKSIANTVWGYMPDRGNLLAQPTPIKDLVPIGSGSVSKWGILNPLYSDLNPSWSDKKNISNFASLYATLAYSLKNRYVLNVTVRNDFSNRFGQNVNERFDPNYSFGLSWDASREDWMPKNIFNMLRFRATYGIQGNAATNRNNDIQFKLGGLDPTYQQFFNTIYKLPNFDLSWEKTKTWNVGLDVGLFRSFMNVMFEYYGRKSDAVVPFAIPYEYGITTTDLNGGIINNQGFEISVEITPINRKDMWLMIKLNTARNFNEVGEQVDIPKLSEYLVGSSNKILKKGYPVNSFWAYSFAGLDGTDGRPLFNNLDVPEEEKNSYYDPTKILVYGGQRSPKYTGGMNLSFRYKSFLFSTNFSYMTGAKKRMPSPYKGFSGNGTFPAPEINLNKQLLDRWKKPGDELHTDIPAFIRGNEYQYELPNLEKKNWLDMWDYSDARILDASFLRCQMMSLTWEMKEDWVRKLGMQRFTVNASVSNLFVIASKRFDGFDPELSGEYTQEVMPRTFTLGLNFSF